MKIDHRQPAGERQKGEEDVGGGLSGPNTVSTKINGDRAVATYASHSEWTVHGGGWEGLGVGG